MPPPNRNSPGGRKGGKPGGYKAGGDPSIRRRKQVERTYGRDRDEDFGQDAPRRRGPAPGAPGGPPLPTASSPRAPRPEPRDEPTRTNAPRSRPQQATKALDRDEPVRLNRFLARAGIASRRESDAIIASGRVTVNGETTVEMGVKVGPNDRVAVDGRPITPVGLTYILMNKPTGVITTTSDERDRKMVMDLIDLPQRDLDGLFPVGRLDRNTSGALLFTTDGDLAHRLMHPRYETVKHYLCRAERPLTDADLDQLLAGVQLDDGPAKADNVQFVSNDPHEIAIGLHEGRNRQIRRMIEALGTRVDALERVAYAGLTLEGLRRGKWRKLNPHEVNTLRRKVKLKAIVYNL